LQDKFLNDGINYKLNTIYKINKKEIREWKKINVKYLEVGEKISQCLIDKEGVSVLFYKED
jgi:hypothetical protein